MTKNTKEISIFEKNFKFLDKFGLKKLSKKKEKMN